MKTDRKPTWLFHRKPTWLFAATRGMKMQSGNFLRKFPSFLHQNQEKYFHRKKKAILVKGMMVMIALLLASGCSLTGKDGAAPQDSANGASNPPVAEGSHGTTPDSSNGQGMTENELSPKQEPAPSMVKEKIVFHFADSDLMDMYKVEKEIEANSKEELPKAALEAWIQGPGIEGLTNLVPPEVIIETLEFKDGIAYVSFSKEIRNANVGSGGEMYLFSQVVLLMQQFGYNATQILVEGQIVESVLGHMSTDEPIQAQGADNFKWFDKK